MNADRWGPDYNQPGWIASLGKSRYRHRFGGDGWKGVGPLDELLGSPTLLLTLDLRDPRLESLCNPKQRCQLPLFSYLNVVSMDNPQRYEVEHATQRVEFVKASSFGEVLPGTAAHPLPERPLVLRKMSRSEIPLDEESYWTAGDSFLGGDGYLRVLGPPLWLQEVEWPRDKSRKKMQYCAAIGYENYRRPSGLISATEPLFFGEMAFYFFASDDLSRVAVLWQST